MIIKTTPEKWQDAQQNEKECWQLNNQRNGWLKLIWKFVKVFPTKRFWQYLKFRDFYCGDDWNFWWAEQFDWYKDLPNVFNSLEVGCGPYTNTRLISKVIKIRGRWLSDPGIQEYRTFNATWMDWQAWRSLYFDDSKLEKLNFTDNCIELLICINVLDHVEDVEKCFSEIYRVLKKGSYFVFGQDLVVAPTEGDPYHPIRLDETYLNEKLKSYQIVLKKVLTSKESRDATRCSGTYIYIGKKV